jgi:DedD protein
MDPLIKQRLVGAIVLVLIAVIFLPMVLNGPPVEPSVGPSARMPEPKPVERPPSLDFDRESTVKMPGEGLPKSAPAPGPAVAGGEAVVAQVGKAEDSDLIAATKEEKKAAKPASQELPASVDKPVAGTWSVQVGGFSTDERASSLRDKLRKAGYPAYIERGHGERSLYKVRVGPYLREGDADAVNQSLKSRQGVKNGIVIIHR